MDTLDEVELFTVNVFQAPDRRIHHDGATIQNDANSNNEEHEVERNKPIADFQNMVSARVIKVSISSRSEHYLDVATNLITIPIHHQGRMLELEHSNLAGPSVKFKTVINYERVLEPNSLIGLLFKSQDGYITKDSDD